MTRTAILTLSLSALALIWARGTAAETSSWHLLKTPVSGSPSSIGGYSAGCVRGARALAAKGEGYQLMRPSRRRHFGHPVLVDYLRGLGARASRAGLGSVLVGDLGQARGGPSPSGHASHQTGLDVDVWYWAPDFAATRALTRPERENLSARSVVEKDAETMNASMAPRVSALLRLAAQNARVARIFVHPAIKRTLCQLPAAERGFLGKLRPWWGHDDHFHVRLSCPEGSPLCEAQAPIEPGDGCAEVEEWFSAEGKAAREREHQKYRAKVGAAPTLPAACQALLEGA